MLRRYRMLALAAALTTAEPAIAMYGLGYSIDMYVYIPCLRQVLKKQGRPTDPKKPDWILRWEIMQDPGRLADMIVWRELLLERMRWHFDDSWRGKSAWRVIEICVEFKMKRRPPDELPKGAIRL